MGYIDIIKTILKDHSDWIDEVGLNTIEDVKGLNIYKDICQLYHDFDYTTNDYIICCRLLYIYSHDLVDVCAQDGTFFELGGQRSVCYIWNEINALANITKPLFLFDKDKNLVDFYNTDSTVHIPAYTNSIQLIGNLANNYVSNTKYLIIEDGCNTTYNKIDLSYFYSLQTIDVPQSIFNNHPCTLGFNSHVTRVTCRGINKLNERLCAHLTNLTQLVIDSSNIDISDWTMDYCPSFSYLTLFVDHIDFGDFNFNQDFCKNLKSISVSTNCDNIDELVTKVHAALPSCTIIII